MNGRREALLATELNPTKPSDAGRPPPTLDLVVPAVPERLAQLRQAARGFAVDNGFVDPGMVALAITEACTSAVLHAPDDQPLALRLTGRSEDGRLVFIVVDRTPGPMPAPAEQGLARLPIIASVADRVSVVDDGHGNRIRITFAPATPA